MIRVIAFDLDDTLWHVNPVIYRAERLLNEWFREQVPGFEYDMRSMGEYRDEVMKEDPDLAGRVTELRRRIIERAMARNGIADATELSTKAMEVFLRARNEIEFFEGALEAITEIAQDYQLGALTNGNADIHRLGLSKHFSFAFSAEDVGAPKPAPDLFHAALEHTGCSPEEMVYVGDDPIKDIDPANAVGLKTVWLSNELRPGPGATEPDHIIDNISELLQAIRSLDH
ncbi:MAG: HAD family hydrolase [Gammaproteobacteria bacterium]|nr:HAD family hydrolase [Gammaproteobacteria bacterium]MBT4494641.1 HAD family hydrolase [Gammaproteobacteria bacterium]MBT7370897.1 HAD family hydrolase [Gammaproteobacteria bacterium]